MPSPPVLEPVGEITRPERISARWGCAILPIVVPLAIQSVIELERASSGSWDIPLLVTGFAGAIIGVPGLCLYFTSAGRRRRLRARRSRALIRERPQWAVASDGIRLALDGLVAPDTMPDVIQDAMPDHSEWHARRQQLVALRAERGAWLDGRTLVLPGAGYAYRTRALADGLVEAEAVGRWLARFDDPRRAWLTAMALASTGPEAAEVGAEAVYRLMLCAPGDPLTARVRAAALAAPGGWVTACVALDGPALRGLLDDPASVATAPEAALRQWVPAAWRAWAPAERRRLAEHPEPAVRWIAADELGDGMPRVMLIALAGDASARVRVTAFEQAERRAATTALDAARAFVEARGDVVSHHSAMGGALVALDPGRALDTPPHLRPARDQSLDRALARLAADGQASDLRLIAGWLSDPAYQRSAQRARRRLRARFPEAVDRGELSLIAHDGPRGALSPGSHRR